MSKVYIVTEGSYSDYRICAVFSSEEKARNMMNNGLGEDVEKWLVDYADAIPSGHSLYLVRVTHEGDVRTVRRTESRQAIKEYMGGDREHWWGRNIPTLDGTVLLQLLVAATDEQHAVKIANEKRAQLIAENLWGKG